MYQDGVRRLWVVDKDRRPLSRSGQETLVQEIMKAVTRSWARGGLARVAMLGTAGALTVVLLGGCGSSASKAASGSSSSAPVATTTSAGTSGSGSSPSPTSASTSSSSKVDIGALGSSFCDTARKEQAQADKNAQALTADDPATLKKFEEQALAVLPAFAAQAPAEIKSSVDVLVAADQSFFKALQAAGFDFTKLSPTTITQFETPAFTAATEKVTDYLKTKCGISESDAPTS
jgi:hypothetical protein